MKYMIVDLEHKRPTVEQARIRLDQSLRDARSQKYNVIKLIHGYGSSGKGGAIKADVALQLKELKRTKKIQNYVHGENFSCFDEDTRKITYFFPQLKDDRDYSRENAGITIVMVDCRENN